MPISFKFTLKLPFWLYGFKLSFGRPIRKLLKKAENRHKRVVVFSPFSSRGKPPCGDLVASTGDWFREHNDDEVVTAPMEDLAKAISARELNNGLTFCILKELAVVLIVSRA